VGRAFLFVGHDTPIEETLEALHDVVKAGKAVAAILAALSSIAGNLS
jgi:aryl-alcohol dehydrogenase-like predicted oxidoreductase